TSRTVLQTIQARGLDVNVIEYLQTPWSHDQLAGLIRDAGLSVRQAMRTKESLYQELNLDDDRLGDEALLAAMVAHPILVNRPFVVTDRGTRLCRPADIVEEILPD